MSNMMGRMGDLIAKQATKRARFQERLQSVHGIKGFFVAEVKTESRLSGWRSEKSFEELLEIATKYGDWVAAHTEVPWGGCVANVVKARSK